MRIAIIASEETIQEFLPQSIPETAIVVCAEISDLAAAGAVDAVIDLQFDGSASRKQILGAHRLVLVNSVTDTLTELDLDGVRFNGWPGFLQGAVVEAAAASDQQMQAATAVLNALGKQPIWLTDETGFPSARVICSIINEAYLALEEGVSTEEEIDKAMKLGVNYPYGPFEWAGKIGVHNVFNLLSRLARSNSRYGPSTAMSQSPESC